jgi:hypothetical protein
VLFLLSDLRIPHPHKPKGYVSAEEKTIQRAGALADRLLSVVRKEEDSSVKFNAMIYLLNDFFIDEILNGRTDIKGMQSSLEETIKHMLLSVERDVSGAKPEMY